MQEQARRRPGVAAEDVEEVLRLHADRVHDAVRRLGVSPHAAVEVVRQSALSLVDAVAHRPETVPDAVGWWFAEARRLAHATGPDGGDLPVGGGVLSADEDQLVLAEAVAELPEQERLALLLRDAYGLPVPTVAGALEASPGAAASVVARARSHAVPLLDDEPAPAVPTHAESLAALAGLAEHDPDRPAGASVRQHVRSCAACAAVTASQERVRLLIGALSVVSVPEAAREAVLQGAVERTRALLPAASALALTEEEAEDWDDDPRVLPPLLATLCIVLAVLLGTGSGVLLSRGAGAVLPASSGVLPAVTLPPVEAPQPIRLPPDLPPPPPIPTPSTTVVFLPPRTTAPAPPEPTVEPTASPSPTPAPTPVVDPTLVVDPTSGPNGATLQVSGAGWTPGTTVALDYLDPTGRPTGSRSTAAVDPDGTFRGELEARNPAGVPGRHTVRASDGVRTRTASYDATT